MKAEYESVGEVLERIGGRLFRELAEHEAKWLDYEMRRHAPQIAALVDAGQHEAASRLAQALGYEVHRFADGRIELRRNEEILATLPFGFALAKPRTADPYLYRIECVETSCCA